MPFGNVIDIFVDRAFGHNFDPNQQFDRDFIDRVHTIDEHGFQSGLLKPCHLIASMTTQDVSSPHVSRGLWPQNCIRSASPR